MFFHTKTIQSHQFCRCSKRVADVTCTQRLITEARLGAALNLNLLVGGACVALSSSKSGDGRLRVFRAGAATVTGAPAHAPCSVLDLPAGEAVIAFVEVGASILGISVGESLGFGARLHTWAGGALVASVSLERSDTLAGDSVSGNA